MKRTIRTMFGLGLMLLLAGAVPQALAVSATGGTITNYTDAGGTNWTANIFTNVGTTNLTVTSGGNVKVLVVGGGGGGGSGPANFGGGGGGGGGVIFTNILNLEAGIYDVVVGFGGPGGGTTGPTGNGTNGGYSALSNATFNLTAGGGGGGGYYGQSGLTGGTGATVGGSGGGHGRDGGNPGAAGATLGNGVSTFNNAGGAYNGNNWQSASGGGGAGQAGFQGGTDSGVHSGTYAQGGAGTNINIGGTNAWYAGGGGGTWATGGGTAPAGGIGGGGAGANGKPASGTAGTANTGGGGGGGDNALGGDGGAGIVIVSYLKDTSAPMIQNLDVSNVTTNGAVFNGYLVSTGISATTVYVLWGTNNGAISGGWANTNGWNPGDWTNGSFPGTNIGLTASQNYYYTYAASNATTNVMALSPQYLITGELNVQVSDPTGRVSALDLATFTVTRPASCTNAALVVNYALGGTATKVTDYAIGPVSGAVVIAQGQTSGSITVTPVFKVDAAKTVILTLTSGPYAIGTANSATATLAVVTAIDLIWTGNTDTNWNTTTTNWTNASGVAMAYADLDTVTFNDSCVRSNVNIVGTVGPGSILVTNATKPYIFSGGAISGACGLVKSGANTVFFNNGQLLYSGNTTIDGGLLEYDYNISSGSPANVGGSVTLNGGALRYQNYYGGNFMGNINDCFTVSSNGGTIGFECTSGSNASAGPTLTGTTTLNGNLAFVGNVTHTKFGGTITIANLVLNNSVTISNNTSRSDGGSGAYPDVALPTTNSAPAYTLTMAGTSGGGFRFTSLVSTGLNLSGLAINAPLFIDNSAYGSTFPYTDPFTRIVASGGQVTVGAGQTLTFNRCGYFAPSNIAWGAGSTLYFRGANGGNAENHFALNGTLQVGGAGNPSQFQIDLYRAGLGTDSGQTNSGIQVNNGGTLTVNMDQDNSFALFNANVALVDGAVVQHNFNWAKAGGFMRYGNTNTLTLGDGTGTPSSPGVVTVRGNQGADTNTFNIGWATNMTVNGLVKMTYANIATGAASYFNVGWSGGGNVAAALLAFKTTSGGTEFAPLTNSGGVAVVGPASGPVAILTNTATVSTAGAVGFYNAGPNNTRGNLGLLVVTNGGTLAFSTNGTVMASNVTFYADSTQAVTVVGTASNAIGYLKVTGTLTFNSGATLIGFSPARIKPVLGFWYVAEATTISNVPSFKGFSAVEIEPGNPQRLKVFEAVIGTVFSVW